MKVSENDEASHPLPLSSQKLEESKGAQLQKQKMQYETKIKQMRERLYILEGENRRLKLAEKNNTEKIFHLESAVETMRLTLEYYEIRSNSLRALLTKIDPLLAKIATMVTGGEADRNVQNVVEEYHIKQEQVIQERVTAQSGVYSRTKSGRWGLDGGRRQSLAISEVSGDLSVSDHPLKKKGLGSHKQGAGHTGSLRKTISFSGLSVPPPNHDAEGGDGGAHTARQVSIKFPDVQQQHQGGQRRKSQMMFQWQGEGGENGMPGGLMNSGQGGGGGGKNIMPQARTRRESSVYNAFSVSSLFNKLEMQEVVKLKKEYTAQISELNVSWKSTQSQLEDYKSQLEKTAKALNTSVEEEKKAKVKLNAVIARMLTTGHGHSQSKKGGDGGYSPDEGDISPSKRRRIKDGTINVGSPKKRSDEEDEHDFSTPKNLANHLAYLEQRGGGVKSSGTNVVYYGTSNENTSASLPGDLSDLQIKNGVTSMEALNLAKLPPMTRMLHTKSIQPSNHAASQESGPDLPSPSPKKKKVIATGMVGVSYPIHEGQFNPEEAETDSVPQDADEEQKPSEDSTTVKTPSPPKREGQDGKGKGENGDNEGHPKKSENIKEEPMVIESAPWIPSSVEEIPESKKQGAAFRLMISCFVHDVATVLRTSQTVQEKLQSEAMQLERLFLSCAHFSLLRQSQADKVPLPKSGTGEIREEGFQITEDANLLELVPCQTETSMHQLKNIIPSFQSNHVIAELLKQEEQERILRQRSQKHHTTTDAKIAAGSDEGAHEGEKMLSLHTHQEEGWSEEINLLKMLWGILTTFLQQHVAHFQLQIGGLRQMQMKMYAKFQQYQRLKDIQKAKKVQGLLQGKKGTVAEEDEKNVVKQQPPSTT